MTNFIPQEISLATASVGLFIALATDQAQILAKHYGAIFKNIAQGYNAAMKIMVINRVGAVLFFLATAYSIDLGAARYDLTLHYIIALSLLLLASILLSISFNKRYLAGTPTITENKELKNIINLSIIASLFNTLGLTIPFLLASTYPEYRLTLSNTGFLFNTIFTILNVFFIENRLARLIDSNNPTLTWFASKLIISRTLSYTAAIPILTIAL
jgi:hypothetical protein